MTHQLILAPLQGFTDAIFRDIYYQHFSGIDGAMAPFISTMRAHRLNASRLKDVLPENNPNSISLIPQILGNVAEDFVFLAENLVALGYDGVNWNMGCPHSKVAKKRRGSGMLPWPDLIDELLEAVFERLPCRLSIKMRLGRYDKKEIERLIPVFERYPLHELIVHPRTGVQMYTGAADPDAFEWVASHTSHRLVYNGDIVSKSVFDGLRKRFPQVQRFMIGRGVLINPFLPAEIKGIQQNRCDDLERIHQFHDALFAAYMEKWYGPVHVTGRMKGFWSYLGQSFPHEKRALKRILKAKNNDQYRRATDLFFTGAPQFLPLK